MGYGAGLLHYNKGPVYCNSVFGVTSVEQQQHKIKKDRQSTLVKQPVNIHHVKASGACRYLSIIIY